MSTDTNAAKPPLTLADLTEEQAIQIAKLAYGDPSFEFVEATTGNSIMVVVHFKGTLKTVGKVDWMAGVHQDFSVWLRYKMSEWRDWVDLPGANQRAIQKLFTEWGAE